VALLSEFIGRRPTERNLRWRLGAFNSRSWSIFVIREERKGLTMSLGALFGFGSVIFLIVMTGAFLYGMTTLRAAADRDNYRPGSSKN